MRDDRKRILFVGAESARPAPDGGVPREFSRIAAEWDLTLCADGGQALSILETASFDAVLVDEQLADMDGGFLLDLVEGRRPEIHRFLVADLADPRSALKSGNAFHQRVPKPVEAETLRRILERSFGLGVWLSNSAVRSLVRRLTIVPSPPDLYFEVVRALRSDVVDLDDLSKRAAQDPALTARLLQMANSAALGLRHKVTNVAGAITYLGLERTRSLILLAHTFSYCDKSRVAGFSMERLWQHSLTVGSLARAIAIEERVAPDVLDETFLAGLLHDIGELLLAVNLPQDYAAVSRHAHSEGLPLWKAEMERFGASHAEVGAELMAIWNLPLSVVEALALHHHPSKLISSGFSPLTAVHVADALEVEFAGKREVVEASAVDMNYLADLGLAERVEAWREACDRELEFHFSLEVT